MSESRPYDIRPVSIKEEVERSYLDYAMSVIVSRALPDVRDGLKPVQRRILYSMYEQGNTHDKPYKKSARIVGDVIGKYHPHGDAAVYDALVRMAQDFTMRMPLIDGQGNFGSVDGDSPAAMRYTEVRLTRLAEELLEDIDKETVDWGPNYDDSLEEPLVLPARIPNLLLNGASGIAVGMSTSIPPHNLQELCSALLLLIDRPDATIEEIVRVLPGPDFPTGATILGKSGILEAYRKGQGSFKVRARAKIETTRRDREAIVFTEIPYQVNKARVIQKIADLVKEKKLEGIQDLRDESDREGIRIVVELKKGENPQILLNRLYQLTDLEHNFHVQLIALKGGRPQLFDLKGLLTSFLEHREEVVVRRTRFELRKAEERAHILEGLVRALDRLDEVISLIRSSPDPDSARRALINLLDLSEQQANAILEMRLQRLTALERKKILEEHEGVLKRIAELKEILKDRNKVLAVIREELEGVKARYPSPRRTEIAPEAGEFTLEDLIADEEMIVLLTYRGYVKRVGLAEFRKQQRGGRGKVGMGTREEDWVHQLFVARTHSTLLCFTSEGRVHAIKVHELPEASRTARGIPIVHLLKLREGEKVTTIVPVRDFEEKTFLFFVTQMGFGKRTSLSEFQNVRAGGIQAIGLREGDHLVEVLETEGKGEVVLITRGGYAIRFREEDVRDMGRQAQGVRLIQLQEGDQVVSAVAVEQGLSILTVTEKGFSKRTPIEEYRLQSRGGKGVRTMRLNEKTGRIADALAVRPGDEMVLVTNTGKILRLDIEEISERGRTTQGVRTVRLDEGEVVARIARVIEEES